MTYIIDLYLSIYFQMSSIKISSAGSLWGQLVFRPEFRYFRVSPGVVELVVASDTSFNQLSMVAESGLIWFEQSSALKKVPKSPIFEGSESRSDSKFDLSDHHFLKHLVIIHLLPAWSVKTTPAAHIEGETTKH
jgi:hypothetical protein